MVWENEVKIKDLQEKARYSKPDSVIERNIELSVSFKLPFNSKDIIMEDETGTLSAIVTSNERSKKLETCALKKKKVRIKGYLAKSMFENVAFEIEEILD